MAPNSVEHDSLVEYQNFFHCNSMGTLRALIYASNQQNGNCSQSNDAVPEISWARLGTVSRSSKGSSMECLGADSGHEANPASLLTLEDDEPTPQILDADATSTGYFLNSCEVFEDELLSEDENLGIDTLSWFSQSQTTTGTSQGSSSCSAESHNEYVKRIAWQEHEIEKMLELEDETESSSPSESFAAYFTPSPDRLRFMVEEERNRLARRENRRSLYEMPDCGIPAVRDVPNRPDAPPLTTIMFGSSISHSSVELDEALVPLFPKDQVGKPDGSDGADQPVPPSSVRKLDNQGFLFLPATVSGKPSSDRITSFVMPERNVLGRGAASLYLSERSHHRSSKHR